MERRSFSREFKVEAVLYRAGIPDHLTPRGEVLVQQLILQRMPLLDTEVRVPVVRPQHILKYGHPVHQPEVWECAKKRYARQCENWAGLGVLTL